MAKVLIPTPLRQFTGKQDAVTVAGATVGEVLNALTAQCPVCGEHPTITRLIDYHQFCGVPQIQETKVTEGEIDVTEVKAEARPRRPFRADRRARAARVPDLPHPRRQADPAGRSSQAPERVRPQADIVIHCKSGMRSAKACGILRQAGFQHVRNMKGGILAWSDKVDPSVPKY